jgi:uncharacterized protein
MPYLIDGHNLISYLPDIDLSDPHDEAKLVLKLRGFAARERRKIVVVFDEGLPGGHSQLSTYSVKVVFASSKHSDADSIIRQRIKKEADVRSWIVVSSDREVLAAAERRGMEGLRCVEFATKLVPPKRLQPDVGERSDVYLTPNQVAEWMRIFGFDPNDEIGSTLGLPPPTDLPPNWQRQRKLARRDAIEGRNAKGGKQRKGENGHTPLNEPLVTPEMGERANIKLGQSQIDAWMTLFGGDPENPDNARIDHVTRSIDKTGEETAKRHTRQKPQVNRGRGNKDNSLSWDDIDAWEAEFGGGDDDKD